MKKITSLLLLVFLLQLTSCSKDENEVVNTPPVINEQTFSVAENVSDTFVIGKVIATDVNDDTLSYTIKIDADNLFEITNAGEISLRAGKMLDYETKKTYTITLEVSDGTDKMSATITINVTDINENTAPVINAQTFTVAESINDTFEIGAVVATDAEANTLNFSITANDAGLFEITNDGKLSLVNGKNLDFQTTTTHSITVEVSDGNLTSDNTITINVTEDAFKNAFITKWNVTAGNLRVVIPKNPSLTYNYDIDWGDGTISSSLTEDGIHTYANAGVYTVKIKGNFPHMYFFRTKPNTGTRAKNSTTNNHMLSSIEQWGNIEWESFYYMFHSAVNLVINATDAPDLTKVTSIERAFFAATGFNSDISNWNTSNITNMEDVFYGATSFNQDISGWNTSNVVEMGGMFRGAKAFNQDISGWNTNKVKNFEAMFYSAENFDQNIGSWSLRSVQGIGHTSNLGFMFSHSGMSSINFGKTLKGWAENSNTPNNLSLGATGIQNCASYQSYRNKLVNDKGWSIGGTTDQGC